MHGSYAPTSAGTSPAAGAPCWRGKLLRPSEQHTTGKRHLDVAGLCGRLLYSSPIPSVCYHPRPPSTAAGGGARPRCRVRGCGSRARTSRLVATPGMRAAPPVRPSTQEMLTISRGRRLAGAPRPACRAARLGACAFFSPTAGCPLTLLHVCALFRVRISVPSVCLSPFEGGLLRFGRPDVALRGCRAGGSCDRADSGGEGARPVVGGACVSGDREQ